MRKIMKIQGWITILLPLIFASITLTACSATTAVDNLAPSIKIVIPTDDPTIAGLPVDGLCPVLVEVSNFKLVDKPGEANIPGEGHIHYYLDSEPCEVSPDKANFADTSETLYYWPAIGRGPHTFRVELVNNDHTPLDPPVTASASVTAGLFADG